MIPRARRAGRRRLLSLIGSITILAGLLPAAIAAPVLADSSTQALPFTQNWSNLGLIATDDIWAGVPGIEGFRGDGLVAATAVDPQTVLADGAATPLDVNADETTPNTFTTGGIAEFHIADPVVAMQGSGTADAPHLVINIDTTGAPGVTVSYNLRDIDGAADNAVQPVALQYRVGGSGAYTNIPAGFVADASTGPSLATLVTPVSVSLPAPALNQPNVQVRIITTDAVGSDELIGIDDISILGGDAAPTVAASTPADNAIGVPANTQPSITFSEPVTATSGAFQLGCTDQGTKPATVSTTDNITYSFVVTPFVAGDDCTLIVFAHEVTDLDADDPPDNMLANEVISFTITAPPVVPVPLHQDWTNTGLITANDNWSGVPGITGFLGQNITTGTGVNPANLLTVSTFANDLDVIANQTNPDTVTAGGVAEFEIANPVVALNGSGTADAPYLLFSVDATGADNITVAYNVRDLDGSTDDAIQPVALQYRIGSSGPFTNIAAGFVPDATQGPSLSGLVTPVSAVLPSDANDEPLVQVRVITSNAVGNDEWVGIDDISITAGDEDAAPSVDSTNPVNGAVGIPVDGNISIEFSEPVNVTGSWFSISCGTSLTHSAAVSGASTTFSLDPDVDFANSESCTVTVFAAQVADQDTDDPPDTMAADKIFSFTTAGPFFAIHDIQGAAHISPHNGDPVTTMGIATALTATGFYLQEPVPDADDATSEGLFVFTSTAPTVAVGDSLRVAGNVSEFRPGGAANNLTTTEIDSPTIRVLATGNPLPPTTVIGAAGRVPPTTVIDDDATGDVETSGSFDPATDGIDFYESLEGMRVQVNDPVTVGPRNSFGEIWVLADDGAGAAARTNRGGIVIRPTDFNPEKIQLDDGFTPSATPSFTPDVSVGDHFTGPAVGVLDYNFSNFEINLTAPLTAAPSGIARETTTAPGLNQLAVATFNVENLDALEPQSKFDALANQIVNHLLSPDVIALEEIQDNNGANASGTTDADQTLGRLIAAISAAGGPTYDFRQINPVSGADGGEPGGNIRVGFLFRTDRGLAFVDRPGGDSTTPNTVVNNGGVPELQFSPGRVDPTNTAWNASRKPLAAEFTYRGQTFFLIANHFNSKGGDQPLFGRFQPPARVTETQRHQQAQVLNNFVDSILAVDANAKIVVLGDINDFEFSETMNILTAGDTVLHDLMNGLPQDQRYSYVFEGNSQVLDHIIVSSSLLATSPFFDPVHVNAEFFDQLSDHDPSVALFSVNGAPTVDAGGPYSVVEGSSVTVSATGSDPNGDALMYEWDLDNNGLYEAPGQTATFNAPAGSAPSVFTIRVRATDPGGLSSTDTATVQVTWPFTGVFAPLLNPPTENTVNAGAGIPIKFMLGGDQGLDVIASGYPRSIEYTCGTPLASRPTDATTPTQSTGFTYNPSTEIYNYSWKTQKSWGDTCRRFVLKLTDGTFHYVDIQFVK